jgi:cytochrome oxidase assembly protein ShyY1
VDVAIIRPPGDCVVKPAARMRASTATRVAAWTLAVVLIPAFVMLGRWQLHRAQAKEAMLDGVAQALARRIPVPLSEAGRPDGYDWSSGHGRFADGPVLLLDSQRRGEAVGVRVFAPFLPDAGGVILVDMGWLPLPGNRVLPSPVIPVGDLALRGLLAPPPATGLALGPDHVVVDPRRWLLTRIDHDALAKSLGPSLAPRVLRLDPALPMGFARDLVVLPNTLTPERHRGYAVQWFGLAFATLVTALVLGFRRTHE